MSSETAGQLLDNLCGFPGTIQQVLHREDALNKIVEHYNDGAEIFSLADGSAFLPTPEGALKLNQISYNNAERF